jgi:hypothetical protein
VVTAAWHRVNNNGGNCWKVNKGKWLRDIFKASDLLQLTNPNTPATSVFKVPAGDTELQESVDEMKDLGTLFGSDSGANLCDDNWYSVVVMHQFILLNTHLLCFFRPVAV